MADVEQPKDVEETLKTADADGSNGGSEKGGGGDDVGASLIKSTGDLSDHEQALLISSRRDAEDARTKPFVVTVAVAAALGGLIFGFDSK